MRNPSPHESLLVERLSQLPGDRRDDFLRRLRGADTAPEGWVEQVLHAWNRTAVPRPSRTIVEVFDEVVARFPDHAAVVDSDGSLTYRELAARSRLLADRLGARGVGFESPVGLLLPRGDRRAVIAILAVLRVGGHWVPLDPATPARRIADIVDAAAPVTVLTDGSMAALLPSGTPLLDLDRADDAPVETTRPIALTPGQLAYAIHTSGSTGRPKAVMIEHGAVVNFIGTVQGMFELTAADRVLQYASLSFDVSVFEIFAALLTGASLHLVDEPTRTSVPALTRLLVERRITVADLPPAIMTLLDPADFPELRIAFVGGEAFTGELTTRWAAGRRFFNGYGPTECTVTVVAKECAGYWPTSPPIGRAMDNHEAYALDERMRPVPVGTPGELYIGGAGLARGYRGMPALTAERFVPDPYSGRLGARLYRTGDLVSWNEDGDLVFLGRIDRQVQVNGHRVEMAEIESALARVPGVRQCVVLPDDGAGPTRLTAYVVGESEGATDGQLLRSALAELLPPYMLPHRFAPVPRIPLNTSGKTDTAALTALAGVVVESVADVPEEGPAPHSTAGVLAERCYARVLPGLAVHGDEDFFELGGDSIQAIQLLAAVRAEFGVEIRLADFFRSPTLDDLAAAVREAQAAPDSGLGSVLAELEDLDDAEIARLLAESEG